MARKTKQEKNWKPGPDDKNAIFVRSELDDYGLDVYEFRVLGHIARREGRKKDGTSEGCFAKQKNIAQVCGMSHRKAQDVLRILYEAGMIEKEMRQGTTNVYKLAVPSKWKHPSVLKEIRKRKPESQGISYLSEEIIEETASPNELTVEGLEVRS